VEIGKPDEDATGPRKLPVRKRKAKTDPPELAARAGEVAITTGPARTIDVEEPRIIIADDLEAPPPTVLVTEITDDTSTGVVIHQRVDAESQPILLERRRPSAPAPPIDDDTDVVLLAAKKPAPRPDKRTQMGIGALAATTRTHRDTEAIPPSELEQTTVTMRAVSRGGDDSSDEIIAPPPPPSSDDTNPNVLAAPPRPTPPRARSPQLDPAAPLSSDDDELGPATNVMSAVELDAAIPQRTTEVIPAHLDKRTIDYDPLDDGWGPPGTTIPPPLLGAIPGSEDETMPGSIPVADIDDAPLIVAAPSPPEQHLGPLPVRALEDATARLIELIRTLDHALERDEVVAVMIQYLAESHRRAGFFVIKGGELGVFAIQPRPAVLPYAALRLDRPSTLQDVVGTRLPYRGPTHDEPSRVFLRAALGAPPPEILLVPVAVRERVVGVLFGEQRTRHTFDDQLALASRAAGTVLERILKSKRS